ncbi:HAD family hydrolase [Sphingomonas antarctica]|uniref:HAD family hydrolase n=1 Tax=Sphingomonas antarctica TaxID=2040274 RepID=UPI0039E82585
MTLRQAQDGGRPLVITDCDEVLLHMVSHFRDWLAEAHAVDFALDAGDFGNALTKAGQPMEREAVWPLLNGFFRSEMPRQTLVPGAREALARLSEQADVVVLTNLMDEHQGARADQLRAVGIDYPVFCNQGGKGAPVARLIAEYRPSMAVFVDDLPQHHASVAREAPDTWRLHMIAEPILAARMPPAPDAHARIDDWATGVKWIEARLAGEAV